MRLWVISDLHIDAGGPFAAKPPAADVAVVAGDVQEGLAGSIDWLARHIRPAMPVVFVAGNHEFYGNCHGPELARGRAAARAQDIHLLEDGAVQIGEVRFAGGTLWTDYAIHGTDTVDLAMMFSRRALNDHARIGWRDTIVDRFRPEHARALHEATLQFLEEALQQHVGGPTVVVTHHAPHPRSIHPRFTGDPVNAAFASDLTDFIGLRRPELWVHGHTHSSFDYRIGPTRVLCNPRGYGAENPPFDPGLVVEV